MGGLMAKTKKKDGRATDYEIKSRLDQQRNNLIIFKQKTEAALENDTQRAKQLIKQGKREETKTVLKRKRYREQQLWSSNAQLDRLDQVASVFQQTCSLTEVSHSGSRETKLKRGKWRSIIKRKLKINQRSSNTRKKLEKKVDKELEIQVLNVLNTKERKRRDKIYTKTRNGIQKQKEIEKAMRFSLKLETGDEEAIREELEAILNASYTLPNIDQDIGNEVQSPCGSTEVTAEIEVNT